ncbi:MAG TPA: alanine--glyoxylate aminotransferase family protein [Candidatus Lustribacter sp.]|nr:alanine--glyoxylate aminotransferase family protein [Candidatus Lustribacter sp.]
MKQLLFIPGPVTVAEPVLAAMGKPMIDHRGPEFKELQASIVSRLKPVFGTSGDVLLLGCSGTGGLEAAMTNMFGPGEKVLVAPVGVFGNRFAEIARTWGVEVEILPTEWGRGVDAKALKARLEADTKREIKGVVLTHNETSTGVQNPMGPLADAIRAHGAYSLVDSVSGLAASEFTMDAWGFDVVVAASQKALGVPPGMAMVAVSKRAWDKMASVKSPRYYLDLKKALDFQAIGQTPCTPPVSIAYALDVALDRYAQEGPANVWARHQRNTDAIVNWAEGLGLELFAEPGMRSVTVTAIKVPAGVNGDEIRKKLRVERGYVLGGGQEKLAGTIIRIGTMGEITPRDLTDMLSALETELIAAGFKAKAVPV